MGPIPFLDPHSNSSSSWGNLWVGYFISLGYKMIRILVGPNDREKREYIGTEGHDSSSSYLSTESKMRYIKRECRGFGSPICFNDVDSHIDFTEFEKLAIYLIKASRRGRNIFVSTHSPLLLNWFDDGVAVESTHMVKDEVLIPYFVGKRLKSLDVSGPGEVLADYGWDMLDD